MNSSSFELTENDLVTEKCYELLFPEQIISPKLKTKPYSEYFGKYGGIQIRPTVLKSSGYGRILSDTEKSEFHYFPELLTIRNSQTDGLFKKGHFDNNGVKIKEIPCKTLAGGKIIKKKTSKKRSRKGKTNKRSRKH